MRKVPLRDLRLHASELVRAAENGEVIVIERRGKPVAEIGPINRKKQPPLPDMSDIWSEYPQVSGDSTQYISENSDR